MIHTFNNINWEQFELLCGTLLTAEGFRRVRRFGKPGQMDHGIDWIFNDSDENEWVAQTKHFTHNTTSPSQLRRAAAELQRGLKLLNATNALLIISIPLTDEARNEIQSDGGINVWDANKLSSIIEKHPKIQRGYLASVAAGEILDEIFRGINEQTTKGSELIARLGAVPAGREGWREYEDVCIEILLYAFAPPLRLPKIQSSTEDGLDRRDAIYPIGNGGSFWQSIKHEHSSRMVVAEFKNLVDPVGQREVESLEQYLLAKAKRTFGLLCSRHEPSSSALRARRRAWMTAENVIVFLSDEDLAELIRTKDDGGDPSDVLDAKMDDFFITLAP
ncbi:restriction endonuclease [Sorangium sp. So ce363]|uniref:restriction endonuclease n=1 Tax=Sorangium sp. So ce363 TaxID=3133304 RepID=UPI003F6483F2